MSAGVGTVGTRNPWLTADAWRRLFRDRPLIPLLALLAIMVLVLELVRPGIVSPSWLGVTLRAAVPLAILAGCQTLAMLTGGIDLSVGRDRLDGGLRHGHPRLRDRVRSSRSPSGSSRRSWPGRSTASGSGSSRSTR